MINQIAKMNKKRWLPALVLSAFVGLFPSCQKDILEGQPEWLGNSIYERLQEGIVVNGEVKTFNYMLTLIDKLDQKEVLSKTGSKTLFVASDDAFDEWFKTNDWGVRKFEDLSSTQMKMLMNSAMINNSYLLELMSNVQGNPPQMGLCMRRPTAASIFDTVYSIAPADMPVNPLLDEEKDVWKRFRESGITLKMLKDNTATPMIHFLPRFMTKNKITSEDLEVMTNHKSKSNDDSWINGHKVISAEQTCKNGYIYVVDGVIEPSRNMAEIITENPNTQLWGKMLNRFSVPVYDPNSSREYNRLNGTHDSIYTLRYFSDWAPIMGGGNGIMLHLPEAEELVVGDRLSFDPGWNQYMYRNPMGYDMHYDAGAMIVPTDDAIKTWWDGAGSSLKSEYHELDSLPIDILATLMRVHMLPSFIESVPSKFRTIVDDAKVELGINAQEHVIESFMGCNGVVYVTNTLFPPSEFRSVVYPALSSQSLMSVIYRSVKLFDFGPFLNSMESKFTMILPYNTGKSINPKNTELKYLQYIDPCTYSLSQQTLYEFYFDPKYSIIVADRYIVDVDQYGTITWDGSSTRTTLKPNYNPTSKEYTYAGTELENRLSDMVDNLIIIGRLNPEQKYYKTKAGSTVYVDYRGQNDLDIAGGWQCMYGNTFKPIREYDMTKGVEGNGVSYGVAEVPMTSPQSVYEVLKAHAKADAECTCAADSAYRLFFEFLQSDTTETALLTSSDGSYVCANHDNEANKNIRLFDNYNYTVYVPTNESIRKMIADGFLPTWDDHDAVKNDSLRALVAERIQSFLRYHIQDNSIFVGGEPQNGIQYESSKLNEVTRRFYSITVNSDANGMTVKDQLNKTCHVVKTEGLYNNNCREFWMSVSTSPKGVRANRSLVSSSNAVVHQIDGVLKYSEEMNSDWHYILR